MIAAYNEKAKAGTMKYMKEKRDKLTLNLSKIDMERYKKLAESQGKTLTSLICKLPKKMQKKTR